MLLSLVMSMDEADTAAGYNDFMFEGGRKGWATSSGGGGEDSADRWSGGGDELLDEL